jgi:hypothetical protein
LIRQEAQLLQYDYDGALSALPKLFKSAMDRRAGLTIAEMMAEADEKVVASENRLLKRLNALLVR